MIKTPSEIALEEIEVALDNSSYDCVRAVCKILNQYNQSKLKPEHTELEKAFQEAHFVNAFGAYKAGVDKAIEIAGESCSADILCNLLQFRGNK